MKRKRPPSDDGRSSKRRRISSDITAASPSISNLESRFAKAKKTRSRLERSLARLRETEGQAHRDSLSAHNRLDKIRARILGLHELDAGYRSDLFSNSQDRRRLERSNVLFVRKNKRVETVLERQEQEKASLQELLSAPPPSGYEWSQRAFRDLIGSFASRIGFSVTFGVSVDTLPSTFASLTSLEANLSLDCSTEISSHHLRFILSPCLETSNVKFIPVTRLSTTRDVGEYAALRDDLGSVVEVDLSSLDGFLAGVMKVFHLLYD